jgi:hypothetical protein
MKIILSHDVDHLTVWEHLFKDAILPKFAIRSQIELVNGKIGGREYLSRISDLFKNKWNGIDEVMAFNDSRGIKSTFFIGVNNGVGLSYPVEAAALSIRKIIDRGFEAGVHGINYADYNGIKKEYDLFRNLSGLENFGMRMHYLRSDEHTLENIAACGYRYDATDRGIKNPYRINGMWEFPLQVMDGWIINGSQRWQTRNLEQAKIETLEIIKEAENTGLEYLSILFHDRYFSDSFQSWRAWYCWLVDYLLNRECQFLTHTEAILELEK